VRRHPDQDLKEIGKVRSYRLAFSQGPAWLQAGCKDLTMLFEFVR